MLGRGPKGILKRRESRPFRHKREISFSNGTKLGSRAGLHAIEIDGRVPGADGIVITSGRHISHDQLMEAFGPSDDELNNDDGEYSEPDFYVSSYAPERKRGADGRDSSDDDVSPSPLPLSTSVSAHRDSPLKHIMPQPESESPYHIPSALTQPFTVHRKAIESLPIPSPPSKTSMIKVHTGISTTTSNLDNLTDGLNDFVIDVDYKCGNEDGSNENENEHEENKAGNVNDDVDGGGYSSDPNYDDGADILNIDLDALNNRRNSKYSNSLVPTSVGASANGAQLKGRSGAMGAAEELASSSSFPSNHMDLDGYDFDLNQIKLDDKVAQYFPSSSTFKEGQELLPRRSPVPSKQISSPLSYSDSAASTNEPDQQVDTEGCEYYSDAYVVIFL